MSKFPVTSRTDVLPSENSFAKKKIGSDWGAETSAANLPNTPSMKQFERKSSFNPYADYCDDDSPMTADYEDSEKETGKEDGE
jgi:hypothetical protein